MASKTVKNTIANESSEPKRRRNPKNIVSIDETKIDIQLPKSLSAKSKQNKTKTEDKTLETFKDKVYNKIDEIRLDVASKMKKINKDFVIDNVNNLSPNVRKSDDILVDIKLIYNTYNYKDCKFINNFTKAKKSDTKIKKIEMLKDKVSLDDFIEFFLTVQDNNMKGQYHEYIPFQKMLFNYEEPIEYYFRTNEGDINKNKIDMYSTLINYYGFCDDEFPDNFCVRYETKIINLIKNRFKYDDFLGKYHDKIKIVFQYTIENETKFNDICIMDDIIIEIHENDLNHYDNLNDNYKKEIAIKDNKIIIYFYQIKDTRDRRNYFNSFFLQLKKLVQANLFRKYPESCMHFRTIDFYEITKETLNKRQEELKNAKKNNDLEDLEDLQFLINEQKIILECSSRDTLGKFFGWRDASYYCEKNKQDERCIDIYELLEETKIKKPQWQQIIQRYNRYILKIKSQNNGAIKYMIDWLTINFIINDPLNDDEKTKRSLTTYHVYADKSYIKIMDIIEYKADLFNKLNAENNETEKINFKKKSDIKLAKKDIKLDMKTAQCNRYLSIIKKNHKNNNKVATVLDTFELELSAPQSKIYTDWKNSIIETDELIKSSEIIKDNIDNDTNNKPKQFIINKIKIDEPPLIINGFKTKFPIIYTSNQENYISKEDLIGILNDYKKIPKKIHNQVIRLMIGFPCNNYDDIPNVITEYKINSLYNHEEQDIVVEPDLEDENNDENNNSEDNEGLYSSSESEEEDSSDEDN